MELTQEHFDKGLTNILEKVAEVKTELSEVKADIAGVKADIVGVKAELKQYTNDAFEVQQAWMEERFKELIAVYDVRERVVKLEQEFREFKLQHTAHA